MDKKWVKFWEPLSNKAFFGALLEKRNVSWSEMTIFGTFSDISCISEVKDIYKKTVEEMTSIDTREFGGVWVDFGLGVKIAAWANPRFDVEVCDLVVRYMTIHPFT
jgi:hypothetical protein